MGTIIYILLALLLLGIMVTVHELGHFCAARACGIAVREIAPYVCDKKTDPAVSPITALTDEIGQSAEIVSRAMPYGLASLLILNENATVASLLHGLYTAALNEVSHSYGAGIAPIREVY